MKNKQKRVIILLCSLLAVSYLSGYNLNRILEMNLHTALSYETGDVSFSEVVFPIIQDRCMFCHDEGNPSGGINLDSYENIIPYVESGVLIGTIKHEDGYSPMPNLKLDDSEIEKIEAWINQGGKDN